jgi:hypothetical protein
MSIIRSLSKKQVGIVFVLLGIDVTIIWLVTGCPQLEPISVIFLVFGSLLLA